MCKSNTNSVIIYSQSDYYSHIDLLVSSGGYCTSIKLVKPLHSPCTRSVTCLCILPLYSLLLLHALPEFSASSEMHGVFVCTVQMKGPRRIGKTAWKQKDSFSCAHISEQSERQLFPFRVSQTLSIPSTVLLADLWRYQKGKRMGGATKVVHV